VLESRASALDFVVTATEEEALLLEDTLVKKHRPPHNVRLKDDKSFLLVRLDPSGPFPRLEPVRAHSPRAGGALHFGPFPSAGALRRTLRILHSVVPLRDCSDAVLRNRSRPCLKHAIGRCAAPCVGLIGEAEYRALVERAIEMLRGRGEGLLGALRARMREEADALRFERAQGIKEAIDDLERTLSVERDVLERRVGRDVVGLARDESRVCLVVLQFRDGALVDRRTAVLESPLPDEEVLGSLLPRLFEGTGDIPPEIAIPAEPNDAEMIASHLARRRKGPVRLLVPRRGPAARRVRQACENAARLLEAARNQDAASAEAAERLAERLRLRRVPVVVDGFDVSNIQGSAIVASRVRFRDGRPDRSGYRRFRPKEVATQDDFAVLHEVVSRALKRDLEADELPDLLVIDGGKGQLQSALAARDEVGAWDVEVVALAKRKTGKTGKTGSGLACRPDPVLPPKDERVYLPDRAEPIPLEVGSPDRALLERIRDEAHRFAITYHRRVRGRLGSALDAIPGIGRERRKRLLRHFGSVEAIRRASIDEIAAVPGIPRALGERVLRALRPRVEPPV
jgi:excinuclease ABC subunit C